MPKIIAQVLMIIGSLLIGFGIGTVVGQATQWQEYFYWIALTISLILGGFFLAWGMTSGKREVEDNVDEDEDELLEED